MTDTTDRHEDGTEDEPEVDSEDTEESANTNEEEEQDQEHQDGEEEEEDDGVKRCELCFTEVERTNLHHLVPKLVLKRRKNKQQEHVTILARLCLTCHRTMHKHWRHAELARRFKSVEEIAEAPEMQEYLAWKRKKSLSELKRLGRPDAR